MSLFLIALAIITGIIFGIRINQLTAITSGKYQDRNLPSKRALLIIDVQNDTVNNKKYTNKAALMDNINKTIHRANSESMDIIYVKEELSRPIDKLLFGRLYIKGTEGAELSSELNVTSKNIFTKEKNDSFSNLNFENFLLDKKITELFIVGADASACVYKTAVSGMRRGYKVTVLKDSIFSVNEKALNKMLDKYLKNDIKTELSKDFLT